MWASLKNLLDTIRVCQLACCALWREIVFDNQERQVIIRLDLLIHVIMQGRELRTGGL